MAGLFGGFQSRATVLSFIDPITKNKKEFALDASLSIDTSMSATVSEFPIENAETISDHVQPKPLTLTVNAMFSESPSQKLLTVAQTIAGGVADSAGQFRGLSATFAAAASSLAVSAPFTNFSRFDTRLGFARLLTDRSENDPEFPKRAMLGLQRAFDQGIIFDIRTYFSDVIYKNMVMNTLSFTQSPSNGDSLSFTFTAQKITTVDQFVRKKTELRVKDPAGSSATKKENKGSKKTDDQPPGSAYWNLFGRPGEAAPTPPAAPTSTNQSVGVRAI